MSMQEELRLNQSGKGDERVAMRIVITVGDVLHQEGALLGDAVVLATRIPVQGFSSAGAGLPRRADAPNAHRPQVHRSRRPEVLSYARRDIHIGVLERALDKFLEVVGQVCAEFAGTSRISMGDSYALTFAKRCPSDGGSGSTIRRVGNLSTG
jgi:hypothetical protein